MPPPLSSRSIAKSKRMKMRQKMQQLRDKSTVNERKRPISYLGINNVPDVERSNTPMTDFGIKPTAEGKRKSKRKSNTKRKKPKTRKSKTRKPKTRKPERKSQTRKR